MLTQILVLVVIILILVNLYLGVSDRQDVAEKERNDIYDRAWSDGYDKGWSDGYDGLENDIWKEVEPVFRDWKLEDQTRDIVEYVEMLVKWHQNKEGGEE